jgi:V8-like Glu-specific endopeptidase
MQNSQDTSQDLRKCTVAIQRSGNGKVLGTGVIVDNDGLILTCYHVVGSIKNNTLDETVDIRFPLMPEIKALARPIKGDAILDIALLQLDGNLPKQTITSAILSETIVSPDDYQSFGFRQSDKVEGGLYSAGKIQGKTYERSSNPSQEIIQLTVDNNRSDVPYGMSGAPVLETNKNKVIGIISASLRTETHDFAIPVGSIIKVYPQIKNKNQGLKLERKPLIDYLDNIINETSQLIETPDFDLKRRPRYIEKRRGTLISMGKFWSTDDTKLEIGDKNEVTDAQNIVDQFLSSNQETYLVIGAVWSREIIIRKKISIGQS